MPCYLSRLLRTYTGILQVVLYCELNHESQDHGVTPDPIPSSPSPQPPPSCPPQPRARPARSLPLPIRLPPLLCVLALFAAEIVLDLLLRCAADCPQTGNVTAAATIRRIRGRRETMRTI